MKKKISLILICGIILLGVCGCRNNNDIKKDSLNEIKENIETKEDVDNKQDENDTKDNSTTKDVNDKEEIKKEETKPTKSNNSSTATNDKKQETTTQSNSAQSSNTESNNDIIENVEKKDYKTNIIGVWSIDNKPHIVKFTEDKVIEIFTNQNYMKEYNYTIDENYVILNETRYFKYDLKDNILYIDNGVYKKRDESYIPSIYYNINVFNGTWELNSNIKKIVLENGYEKELNEEMVITKQNTSGFGSCGGSGCHSYIINFNNARPELYNGDLCYELVDKNTLVQIKCHQDNIIGYSGWEDQTIHNIIYKKIN